MRIAGIVLERLPEPLAVAEPIRKAAYCIDFRIWRQQPSLTPAPRAQNVRSGAGGHPPARSRSSIRAEGAPKRIAPSEDDMARKIDVLLVDDSRTVLAQLERILGDIADVAIVGLARDGAAAIRMASESNPDLVLMDIVMPGLDGLSALRTIHAMHPGIHVAMVSSVGGDATKAEEAFRLGACQVLGKPFDTALIEALVERVRDEREEGSAEPGA